MFTARMKLFALLSAVVLVVAFCCFSCTTKKEAKAEASAVEKLLDKAPDNLLAFIGTNGADEVKPAFDKTSLGRIWNDPGTQSFYQSIKNELLGKIKAEAGGSDDFNKFEVVKDFTKVVLRRPVIIGAASREMEAKVPVYGFAILDAGQRKEQISLQLEKLEALVDEGEIVEVKVGPYMMHGPRENDDVDGYWGWVGNYFVFAINDDERLAIKYLEDSGGRAAPDYLSKVPCAGDGVVIYGDYEKLFSIADAIVEREGGEKDYERVKAVIGEFGLDKIKTVAVRMGFSGSNLVVNEFAKMSSADGGLFSRFGLAEVSMLDMVDRRAMSAKAWNFDIAGMYDTIFRAIKASSPNEAYPKITEGVAKFESEVGFKLRGGLLESLSGPMTFFALPAGVMMEAPGGGPVLIAKLKDKALFEQTMSAIGQFASAKSKGMVQVSSQVQDGRTLNVWVITPLAMLQLMPTWTIVDDYVVIATNTALCDLAVGQMDSRKNSVRSTAGYKSATAKMPRKPLVAGYTDSKVLFNQMIQGVQQIWPMLTMMASKGGVKLPVMLPSLSHIAEEMEPGCYYVWSDDEGYYSHYEGAGIEQSIGTVAGGSLAMGIMMPALARTRQLAHRMLSGTNLSDIGKGCMMYASDHNEKYPENLEELVEEGLLSHKNLVSKCKPKGSTEPSYIYITGQNATVPGNNIIAYDNPVFCVDGVNVLFNDGHVQWMKKEEFLKELEATYKRLGREMPEVKFKGSGKSRKGCSSFLCSPGGKAVKSSPAEETVGAQSKSAKDAELRKAAKDGDIVKARALIGEGADINGRDKKRKTPLYIAIESGQTEMALFLIDKGAKIEGEESRGTRPLHIAAKSGDKDVVEKLVGKGADINSKMKRDWTALHIAVRYGYKDIAEFLVESGADMNAENEEGMTALRFAVLHEREEIEKFLLSKGLKPDIITESMRGNITGVTEMLKKDADLVNTDAGNFTPLHWAAYQGHKALAEALLANGADVNACSEHAGPLHWAVRKNHLEMARLLIANNADVDVRDKNGRTILYNAPTTEIAQLLIDNGADVNARDNKGCTPLHFIVSWWGHRGVMKLLIGRDGDINSKQPKVLEDKAVEGQAAVAELLIAKGADVNAKDDNGLTPLDCARRYRYKAVAELLEKHQGNDKSE